MAKRTLVLLSTLLLILLAAGCGTVQIGNVTSPTQTSQSQTVTTGAQHKSVQLTGSYGPEGLVPVNSFRAADAVVIGTVLSEPKLEVLSSMTEPDSGNLVFRKTVQLKVVRWFGLEGPPAKIMCYYTAGGEVTKDGVSYDVTLPFPLRDPAPGETMLTALYKRQAYGIPLEQDEFWISGEGMYFVEGTTAVRAVPEEGQIATGITVSKSYPMDSMLNDLRDAGKNERAVTQ